MRILHIIDSGGMYGAEVLLLNLIEEQIQQGLNPILGSIANNGCGEKAIEMEARQHKIHVKIFRMHPGPNFNGAWQIIQYAKSLDCDLLHSHGYKGNILLGLFPRRLRKLPLVSTVHGWTAASGFSKMKIYEWFDRISLNFVDAIVLVNKGMLNLPYFKEKVSVRLHVINNGITENPIHGSLLRDDIKAFCEGKRVIGAIGRLSDEKGFNYLIDAFNEVKRRVPDVRLIIIGEGPQRGLLEKKILKLGVAEFVYMPGFVTEASSYLPLFDILVMPSISEGLPIALLEAMREGVPIVASAVGGIPDILADGSCGVLIPPCNRTRLVDALVTALKLNSPIDLLIAQGKKRFFELYTSEKMGKEYTNLYRKLLSDSAETRFHK